MTPPLQSKIVSLAKKRVRPYLIAKQLGVHVDQVYSGIRRARTAGEIIPYFRETKAPATVDPDFQLVVPIRLFSLLKSEAERRGKTPSELAATILETQLLKGVAHAR